MQANRRVVVASYNDDAVASSVRKDVRAGDDPGASVFDSGLGGVDDVLAS